MAKAILLVRVSTERQNLDRQEQELYNLAVKDGYSDENIICIAEKESGIKLDETERNGLNRMKEAIENDDTINCVYVWEISRIARRKKILFSILEYLTKRQIQLIIKEPSIKLLNDDRSINEGSETIFTLFSQISESEMRNKQVRFKRGKERNALIGKYGGGIIKYGYTLDENKNYIINEKEADVVRRIFNMYVYENKSHEKITKELNQLGLTKNKCQKSFVTKTLNSPEYTGKSNRCGLERTYPIIISEELYSQVRKKAVANKTNSDKSQNTYFCKSLIKCKCGSKYVGSSTSLQYICYSRFHKDCKIGIDININLCDSIAWYHAKHLKFNQDINEYKDDNIKYNEKIDINNEKIKQSQLNIDKLLKKSEKLDYDFYINSSIPEQRYNQFKEIFKTEENELNKSIRKWKNENNDYLRLIERNIKEIEDIENITNNQDIDIQVTKNIEMMNNIFDKIDSVTDDNVKKQIINDYIKEINIEEIEKYKKKKVIILDIKGNVNEYIADVRKKKIYEIDEITYNEFLDFYNLEDNEEAKLKYETSNKHDEIPDFKYFEHIFVSDEKIQKKRNLVREFRKKKKLDKTNNK